MTQYSSNNFENKEVLFSFTPPPKIPVVYNTHGYESIENLKKIDKYVDIYLPDIKFYSPNASNRYTGKSNYFEVASKAVKFMFDSKKTVIENGKMLSGVIVRHLILPLNKKDSIMNRVIHKMYIPEGVWYGISTGKKYKGGKRHVSFYKDDQYKLFVKAG